MENTNITYRNETNGDITVCRDLCNALMQHQAAQTKDPLYREILGSMCFENRLQPSFNGTAHKYLAVAYCGEKPVGYVYCAAETVTEADRTAMPGWAARIPGDVQWVYPAWLETPAKVATLNNLYVLPEYRGLHIGAELMQRGMHWLRTESGADTLLVDIANGNDVAGLYEHYGFRYSHEVLGGLITAYWQPNTAE